MAVPQTQVAAASSAVPVALASAVAALVGLASSAVPVALASAVAALVAAVQVVLAVPSPPLD